MVIITTYKRWGFKMKQVKIAGLILVGYVLTMQQVIAGQPGLICPDCAKVPEIDGTGAIIAIGLVAGLVALVREKFFRK